jgi:hypothetical protein
MPRFQGSLVGIERSNALARARAEELNRLRSEATDLAREAASSRTPPRR